jgi:hypothetical protein
VCGLAATSCDDPSTFQTATAVPVGVIDGTVTYGGPLPCTEGGRIVGAAVLLAFDTRLLPPPEGLGTTAASLGVVPGETLFAGVRGRLTFNADGSRWCPDAAAPHVTVGATWAISPLSAATYEIRGFYDHDGNFDPGFSVFNLPTKGDIGGGAIDNAADVLIGKAPIYRKIALGTEKPDGTRVIPDTGSRIGGVAVTLALELPLERPIFHVKDVLDPAMKSKDPKAPVMPSDFTLDTFSTANPGGTEKSLFRLRLAAGVDMTEVDAAAVSPFSFPVKDPAPTLFYSRQDVNGDGVIDKLDHVPDSDLLPALFPIGVAAKLGPTGAAQGNPAVVLQALTIYKSLASTAFAAPDLADPQAEVLLAMRPSVLCLDPADTSKPGTLVVTHEKDKQGNPIIADPMSVKAGLSAQFSRPIEIAYGCLPEGAYSLNLIYGTGQAWSSPNESGVCAASENPKSDTQCGKRARLSSQSVVFTVGPPDDPAYCAAHSVPAACLPPK